MLVDTHCHLDRYPNPDRIAREAEQAGVVIIAMTNLPSHFQQGRSPVSKMRNVRLSLGLHPMLAPHSDVERRLFSEFLPSTSFVGEVGLDFTREGVKTEQAQRETFEFVLREARGKGKILSIHSRRAELAVLEALKRNDIRSAIFHWFTGDASSLQDTVCAGYFFSINGAMASNERGRALLQAIPMTQVLLETDGPYSKTGSKPSRPKDVIALVHQLSDLWQVSKDDVVRLTSENFRKLLRLSEAERARL